MKRTMVLLVLVEDDSDGPKPIDVDGLEVDELSAVVRAKPFLAKAGLLLEDDARRRRAGGAK
jgi:hypothetical protein